jgi:hypothetical protein
MAVDLFWPGTDAPYGYIATKLGLPPPTSSPTTGSVDIDAATADLKKPAAESPVPENAFVGPIDAISSADQAVYSDRSAVPANTLANKFPHPASASTVTPVTQEQVVGPVTLPGDKGAPNVTVASQDESQAGASNQAGAINQVAAPQQIPYTPKIDVLDKQNRYQTLADNTSALTEQGVGLDVAGGELSADELTNAAMLKTEAFKRKEFLRQQEAERQQAIIKRQEAIAAQTEDALAELQRVSKPPARGDYTAAVAMAALAGGSGAEAGARMILGTIEQRIKSRQERWQNEVAGAQTRLSGLNDAINVLNSSGITGKNAFDAQVAIESQRVADQLDLNSSYFAPDKARLAAEMAANLRRVGSQEKIQSIIKDRITEEDKIESNRISAMKKRGSGGGGGGSGGGGFGSVSNVDMSQEGMDSDYKYTVGIGNPFKAKEQVYFLDKLNPKVQTDKATIEEAKASVSAYAKTRNSIKKLDALLSEYKTASLAGTLKSDLKKNIELKIGLARGEIVANLARQMAGGFNPSVDMEAAADKLVPDTNSVVAAALGLDQDRREVLSFMAEGSDEAFMTSANILRFNGKRIIESGPQYVGRTDPNERNVEQPKTTLDEFIASGGNLNSPEGKAAAAATADEAKAKAKIEDKFELNKAKIETDKAYNGPVMSKFDKSKITDLQKEAEDYNAANGGLFKTETKFAKILNPAADSYNQAVETRNQAFKEWEKNKTPETAAKLAVTIENVKILKKQFDSEYNRIKGNIQKRSE